MAPVKTPDVDLPDTAQSEEKTYAVGVGEQKNRTWTGTAADIEERYQALKTEAAAGDTAIRELIATKQNGRGTLIARMQRVSEDIVVGQTEEIITVEELYAVDVLKDIVTSPYFSTAEATKVTDDQAAFVRRAVDETWSQAEITQYAPISTFRWANWTNGMKELRYHMLHGQESYYETAFILRRTRYAVRTSAIEASFEGINTVVAAPDFDTPMDSLIAALPAGEWLYRPPQADTDGKGRWRITQEWQWAEKWSKVYGGTWGLT